VLNNLVQADAPARQRDLRLTLKVSARSNVAKVLEVTRTRDYLPCAGSRQEASHIARSSG
jgi:hypothetical protein